MHTRHHQGGGARIERFTPFAPQFEGDEEGVSRHHHGAERDALMTALRQQRQLAKHEPHDGAGESGDR